MSLNWDFEKEFIGIAIRKDKQHEFIYTGNTLMIFNEEYPWCGKFGDEEPKKGEWGYTLCNFYADKEHLKNCIKANIYDGTEYKKIILIPCREAFVFTKTIKGLWDIEITSHKTKWMKALRTHYRKVGYKK